MPSDFPWKTSRPSTRSSDRTAGFGLRIPDQLDTGFFHETEAGKHVLKAREVRRANNIEDRRYKSMVFTPPPYHGKGLDYS